MHPVNLKTAIAVAAVSAAAMMAWIGAPNPATADHVRSARGAEAAQGPRLVLPIMNPMRGKTLFVEKLCVACHAINGVGGHDAPALDAHDMTGLMNPFDFAAKMWNHAPGMIAAQEGALGEQIYFTGEELADIIAFVHDDETQHTFTEQDITPNVRAMMHHEHGGAPAPAAHAREIGHEHAPGAPPHRD